MAIATSTVIFDGIMYKKGEEIPDFGSIELVKSEGNLREYQGLSKDSAKLPTVSALPQYKGNIKTGSSCLMVDTGDLHLYQGGEEDKWFKL